MSPATAAPGSSLHNAVDIVVAPSAAFDRIRQVPGWGWAFLVVCILGIIGTFIASPATTHALETSLPAQLAANPQIASLPPEKQQTAIANAMNVTKVVAQFSFVLIPFFLLIGALVQGLVMTVANAIAKGDGSFKKYFALSVTVSIVGFGLASVVLGLIVLVRGPGSFETPSAVQSALPSLALLAPGAKGFVVGALGAVNIFSIWAIALLALGMQRVGRIPAVGAWSTAIIMLLITICFVGFSAARNG